MFSFFIIADIAGKVFMTLGLQSHDLFAIWYEWVPAARCRHALLILLKN